MPKLLEGPQRPSQSNPPYSGKHAVYNCDSYLAKLTHILSIPSLKKQGDIMCHTKWFSKTLNVLMSMQAQWSQFLDIGTIDIVHYMKFGRTSDLYLLDASDAPAPGCDYQKCLETLPKVPCLRTTLGDHSTERNHSCASYILKGSAEMTTRVVNKGWLWKPVLDSLSHLG